MPSFPMVLIFAASLVLRLRNGASFEIAKCATTHKPGLFGGNQNIFSVRDRRISKFRFFSSAEDSDTSDRDFWSCESLTVQQAWDLSMKELQERNVSEPEWSVPHLLASAVKLPWSNGFSQLQQAVASGRDDNKLLNRILTDAEKAEYRSLIGRRLKNEPLQYILGKWDFLEYEELIVRPPLLCPRPETEELVALVRKDIQNQRQSTDHKMNILEIGCGTGVIGVALADTIERPRVTAIDIEPVAVATSLENAELILGPQFRDRYMALERNAEDYSAEDCKQFDIVVSNPPYIPKADMATLSPDVVQYESSQALCGGEDGMDVIRTIIKKWATEWGKKDHSVCWMEVDPTHPALLESWLNAEEQRKTLRIKLEYSHRDMSGRDRFVKLTFR